MPAKNTANKEGRDRPRDRLFLNCISFAAALFAVFGIALLLTAIGSEPSLKQPDALLGLSHRLVLALAGLLHLGVSAYLFTGKNLMNQGIALLWPGLNSLIYGYGMLWTQRRGPCPIVVLTGWRLGIWPATLNVIWMLFIAYLVVAGAFVLIWHWKRSKAAKESLAAPTVAPATPTISTHPKPARGFTFIELITVIAVVTVLAGFVLKSGAIMQESSRRTQCRGNLKDITLALQMYANDYRNLLPDCSRSNRNFTGAPWVVNLNTNLVSDLEHRGVERKKLYCPANAAMNDYHHWEYWRYERGRTRSIGYGLLLKGVRELPENLWRTSLAGDGQNPPARTELATDIVASTGGQPGLPLDATANARINYLEFQAFWVDRSSHLAGLLKGLRPAGGNIAFEDGHAEWRDFSRMTHRYTTGGGARGPVTWDF